MLSLKIKFDSSLSLIELSTGELDANLDKITQELLHEDSLWPLLDAFCRARFFDFESVLKTSFIALSQEEVERIIQDPKFPKSSVLSADIIFLLNFNYDCLSWLPADFFSSPTIENPLNCQDLENTGFSAGKHTKTFLQLAYAQPSVYSNWNEWGQMRLLYSDHKWNNVLWRLIGFSGILLFGKDSIERYFLPIYSKIDLDEDPAIDHVMKVISMVAGIKNSQLPVEVISKFSGALTNHMQVLKLARMSLQMREELICLIRHSLGLISDFSELCLNMTKLTLFCHGKTRASWLLNILFIWERFLIDQNYSAINCSFCFVFGHVRHQEESCIFMDTFYKVFFSPESFATIHDVHDLFRFIQKSITLCEPFSNSLELIVSNYLPEHSLLAEALLDNSSSEFPSLIGVIASRLSLEKRLSIFYKRSRNFTCTLPIEIPFKFEFITDSDEQVWIETIISIKKFEQSWPLSEIIPFFAFISFPSLEILDRVPLILKMFFDSITLSTRLWHVIEPSTESSKPTLVPSLSMPPQLLEYVGFVMGRALSANVEIPFVLHQDYFDLVEADESEMEIIMEKLYPEATHRTCPNIERIIHIRNRAKLSSQSILHFISDADFWTLEPENEAPFEELWMESFENVFVENAELEDENAVESNRKRKKFKALSEIAVNGSHFFRKGLRQASLPIDLLPSEILYLTLFK